MSGEEITNRVVKISESTEIPLVGFGTYLISDKDAESVVGQAIDFGYRHIDTAELYRNEKGVGKALQNAFQKKGLKREDIFVTTKLWPGNPEWGDTAKNFETTIETLEQSLNLLQLEWVDLYLIHAAFGKKHRLEQWRTFVELRDRGKTKCIGVSNFGIKHLEEIKKAGLPKPEANQIELHPWSQKPDLLEYMKSENILPIAYSSLVPLANWRMAPGQGHAKPEQMMDDGGNSDSPIKAIARSYNVSEAQLLLRWAVQQQIPVLPKSVNSKRIKENGDLFSFEISAEDMLSLSRMDRGDGVAWGVGDPTKFE